MKRTERKENRWTDEMYRIALTAVLTDIQRLLSKVPK